MSAIAMAKTPFEEGPLTSYPITENFFCLQTFCFGVMRMCHTCSPLSLSNNFLTLKQEAGQSITGTNNEGGVKKEK